jgi:G3E family GTPase
MRRPALLPFVKALNITTIIDAAAFLQDYAALPAHFAAQARLGQILVVNKADLVSPAERMAVAETLRRLNPQVKIYAARYGQVEAEPMSVAYLKLVTPHAAHDHHDHDCAAHGCATDAHDHEHHGHDHDHEHDALGFVSWNTKIAAPCDADRLKAMLDDIAHGAYGDILRVKGITRTAFGWMSFDVAGGRASLCAFAAKPDEQARILAIGRSIAEAKLTLAVQDCAIKQAA